MCRNEVTLSSAKIRLGYAGASMVTTNVIESPHSGVRLRTRRVCRWRNGQMVLRWAAAALLETEKNFRKIMGYRDLWMLKAALDPNTVSAKQEVA